MGGWRGSGRSKFSHVSKWELEDIPIIIGNDKKAFVLINSI